VIFSPGSEEFSESDLKENEEEEDIFGMGTPLGGKKGLKVHVIQHL